ncbi:MAG: hypothetical protein WAM14_09525 [Candidatus Nitrosopolaris sp.]
MKYSSENKKYRTFLKDYKIDNKGTREEKVFIDYDTKNHYQKEYSQWLHLKNLKDQRTAWMPCEYFNQLNTALTSSHSIFNYSNFLALLPNKKSPFKTAIDTDEAHLLETEIVRHREVSISKRRWKRYIPNLKIVDYRYDDMENWIYFLIDIETSMLEKLQTTPQKSERCFLKNCTIFLQLFQELFQRIYDWMLPSKCFMMYFECILGCSD